MPNDDELLTGRAGNEALQNYEPMAADPRMPQDEPDDTTHGSDRDSMIKAANELHASRSQEREPLVPREYRQMGGEHDGEPTPPNKTISLERASDDLKAARDAEVQAIEDAENAELASALDKAKGVATESEIQEWVTQQAEQIAQQKAAQQQAVTDSPPPPADGVDRELYELLMRHPKAAQALQAEVNQVTKAQQQFADASLQNARLAAASLVADIPELQNLDSSQFGLALDIISRSNPQRAAELHQRFGKIQQLYQISQQARAEQQKLQDRQSIAQWRAWEQQENAKWDAFAAKPENQQRIKTVMPEAISLIAESYGITRQELQHLKNTQPLLNTNLGQQILLDAISYRHAQKTAMQNPARAPLPPVQRPGTAPANYRASDGEVETYRSEFLKSPDARSAARFIAARRRSA